MTYCDHDNLILKRRALENPPSIIVMPPPKAPPRVLTIAGSDPSGGAGIEADLKVFTAYGCYGMTCITAVTAQNTRGVSDIHPIPPRFVAQCVDAVLSDIGVDVVKTGMLTSAETVSVVAEAVERYGIDKLVVDPVSWDILSYPPVS